MTAEERKKARIRRLIESRHARRLALGGMLSVSGAGAALSTQPPSRPTRKAYDDPVKEAVARTMVERLAGRGWDLPNLDHQRVDHFVDRFTNDPGMRHRLEVFLTRSGRYLPMISAKLEERDMPHDLIFLAMIESGFDPTAYSHAHASGLWQFIAATGRSFGLRVDSEVDERNHPEKATDAALDYLRTLHDRFGSWYLAAAAYNTGEGRVATAMREVTGSDRATGEEAYYRIWDRLPGETRDYVPLMIAAARIAKEPMRYGFGHVVPDEPADVREVEVQPGTTLAAVADEAGADVDELKELNPHLKRGRAPRDEPYTIKVPTEALGRISSTSPVLAP